MRTQTTGVLTQGLFVVGRWTYGRWMHGQTWVSGVGTLQVHNWTHDCHGKFSQLLACVFCCVTDAWCVTCPLSAVDAGGKGKQQTV